MIVFAEKEELTFESEDGYRLYRPVYMLKDGVEYFVVNRLVADKDGSWGKYDVRRSNDEIQRYKKFLVNNDGKYFKFNGSFDDPFAMLDEMKELKHTFTSDELLYYNSANDRIVDFHGNRREASAAFHYRIYDAYMVESLESALRKFSLER